MHIEKLETQQKYYTHWKIKLNPEKAEAVVFEGPNKMYSKKINRTHKNVRLKIADHIINLREKNQIPWYYSQEPSHIGHVN